MKATSRPIREYKGSNHKRPCGRCGIETTFRVGKKICGTCRSVLSPWEKSYWMAA